MTNQATADFRPNVIGLQERRLDRTVLRTYRTKVNIDDVVPNPNQPRLRYEATCPVFGYGFIFPVCSGEQEDIEERFQEFGLNYNVFFLHIPDDNRVRSFFEESILQNEKKFVDNIKQKLLWTEG